VISTYYITPNGLKTKYSVSAMILISGKNEKDEILVRYTNNRQVLIHTSYII
jgi:hypothetical protein